MRTITLAFFFLAVRAEAQTLPHLVVSREVFIDGVMNELVSASHVAVTKSGIVYVGERGGKPDHVKVFGPDGIKGPVVGRHGSGPGDFRCACRIGVVGDSVWVDEYSDRISVFAPDGKVTRIFREQDVRVPRGTSIREAKLDGSIEAIYSDGAALVRGSTGGYVHMARTYGGQPLIRLTASGAWAGLVGWVPFPEELIFTDYAKSGFVTPPFPNNPVSAIAPDGSSFVVVTAEITGPVPSARVTVIRSTGDTVFARNIPVAAPAIPADELAARYRVGAPGEPGLGETSRQKNGDKIVAAIRAAPRPVFYPPLGNVSISRSGHVLVGFRAEGSERDYLVIDSVGKPVGSFRLPRGTKVMQFDGPVIWTTERDRDGVESVIRYRIQPPESK
jgi:hypothetical protein